MTKEKIQAGWRDYFELAHHKDNTKSFTLLNTLKGAGKDAQNCLEYLDSFLGWLTLTTLATKYTFFENKLGCGKESVTYRLFSKLP